MDLDTSEKYYNFVQFIGTTFPIADYDETPDEEATLAYKEQYKDRVEYFTTTIRQVEEILTELDLYWEQIRLVANRWFETEEETRQWLENILRILKE